MSLYSHFTLESEELEELRQLEAMVRRTLEGVHHYQSLLEELLNESRAFHRNPDTLFEIKAEYLSKVLLLQKGDPDYLAHAETAPIDYQQLLAYLQTIKLW